MRTAGPASSGGASPWPHASIETAESVRSAAWSNAGTAAATTAGSHEAAKYTPNRAPAARSARDVDGAAAPPPEVVASAPAAAGAVVGPPLTPSATKSARSARGAAARARRSVAHARHAKSSSFSRVASGSAA